MWLPRIQIVLQNELQQFYHCNFADFLQEVEFVDMHDNTLVAILFNKHEQEAWLSLYYIDFTILRSAWWCGIIKVYVATYTQIIHEIEHRIMATHP